MIIFGYVLLVKEEEALMAYNGRVKEIWAKVDKAQTANEVYLLLAELIGYPMFTDDPSYLVPYVLVYKGEDADPDEFFMPKKLFNEIWSVPVGDRQLIARKNDTLVVHHKFGVLPSRDDGRKVRYFEIRIASI